MNLTDEELLQKAVWRSSEDRQREDKAFLRVLGERTLRDLEAGVLTPMQAVRALGVDVGHVLMGVDPGFGTTSMHMVQLQTTLDVLHSRHTYCPVAAPPRPIPHQPVTVVGHSDAPRAVLEALRLSGELGRTVYILDEREPPGPTPAQLAEAVLAELGPGASVIATRSLPSIGVPSPGPVSRAAPQKRSGEKGRRRWRIAR